ncbi:hypothetical protein [Halogranum rubrum]|uniref:hypothetical protein n=1 Tax=Halogranum rubrum TaxID=553466 RepID=UPI0012F8AFBE|nr:hypothetical protein [Halogranum salarium]
MTRIGLATSGTVALAGCSGLSGDSSSEEDSNSGGDSTTNNSSSNASSSSTSADGDTADPSAIEGEVENTLDGAVTVDSHRASVDDGTLLAQASVTVTDAAAIDGNLLLHGEVWYSKIAAGNDIDVLREFESDQSYDLTTQFPNVDPAKVEKYTLRLEAVADKQPQN